jgi:hypothetical protein
MKRSDNKGLSRYLCLWAAIFILAVSCLIVTIQSNHAFETKEGNVNHASKTKIQPPGIPPIDEAVPSVIETATFGLG